MGVDAEHLEVDGQHEMIFRRVVLDPWRDIQLARLEKDAPCLPGWRLVAEIEPDAGLHQLGASRGMKMQLDDEVRPFVESPRELVRSGKRHTPRGPRQELAVWELRPHVHAAVTHLFVLGIPPAGSVGTIDAHHRMVDDQRNSPGLNSTALTKWLPLTGTGTTKLRKMSCPSACSS